MNLNKKIAAPLSGLLFACAGMLCPALWLCSPAPLWGAIRESRSPRPASMNHYDDGAGQGARATSDLTRFELACNSPQIVILEETSLALGIVPSAREVPCRMTLREWELQIGAEAVEEKPAQSKDEAKAAHAHYEKAMKKKDANARVQLLQEGAVRFPFSAELHYALGREYHQRAQLDSALVHFERVLNLDETLARKTELHAFLPQAYSALAQQALKLGKPAQAERAAQNALRHDENHLPALSVAAVAAYQLKQYELALAHGARLLKLQPSAQNHNNLAAVYEARGELILAEQHYQQAVVLDANLSEAQKNLQRVRARLAELVATAAREELSSKNFVKARTSAPPKPAPKTKSAAQANAAALVEHGPAATSSQNSSPKMPAAKTEPVKREPAKIESATTTSAKRKSAKSDLAKTELPKPDSAKIEATLPRTQSLARQTAPLALAAPARESFNTVRAPKSGNYAAAVWALAFIALSVIIWRSAKSQPARATAKAFVSLLNKKRNAPPPRAAHALNAEDARMLRRVEEEQKLLSAAATSMNEELPLLAPERARLALPALSPLPIKAEPQIGLQTEMFFAEMIAAAPEIFESTALAAELPPQNDAAHDSDVANVNGRELSNGNAESAAEPIDKALALALPNEGDTASPLKNENALAPAQTPASPMVVTPSAHVAPQEVQTPAPIVRAALEPTPALFEATRTMSLPALAVQRIGRYVIEKELAQGTTGKIYKAWDPKLDRIVVLKTVQYGLSTSPPEIAALKERIYREARAIAKLSHPNIVIVYDVDDQPEFSYLVMEYLEGRDLKQVLEHEHRLECGRALEIAAQVCDAMEYAHRAGVFHRDLKPSNIMLLGKDEVKVMDFGIAKIGNYLSLTQTGRVLGTPSYMAPEQIEGYATDGRADLFSLGVVLYELLVGKRPFIADSLAALAYKIVHKTHIPPSLVNVELPMALDEALNRALAKKPEERYQNATELRAALLEVKAKLG